jgi:hypothetical protein
LIPAGPITHNAETAGASLGEARLDPVLAGDFERTHLNFADNG